MSEYIKFWLAKELIPIALLATLFGGFGLLYAIANIYDKVKKRGKKIRVR